jgi:HEAT repeat protein
MNPAGSREIETLFATALTGGYDDDVPWQAVSELRRIGSREIFDRAAELTSSRDPLARARGIDVLAQLGRTFEHPANNFAEESYAIISELVWHETDPRPLGSAISALGHLGNPLAVPLITNFVAHPNAEIRFHVACALGSFSNDGRSIRALLALTEDSDEDVRDWATFGLGTLSDADSTQIREALLRRLKDSDADVRGEALAGLGKRRDERALPCLIETLEQPDFPNCAIEAAHLMLGLESPREEWSATDYARALRERFTTST